MRVVPDCSRDSSRGVMDANLTEALRIIERRKGLASIGCSEMQWSEYDAIAKLLTQPDGSPLDEKDITQAYAT